MVSNSKELRRQQISLCCGTLSGLLFLSSFGYCAGFANSFDELIYLLALSLIAANASLFACKL